MAAVIAALPGRLGENEPVLHEALQQVQMAFVQVSNALAAAAVAPQFPCNAIFCAVLDLFFCTVYTIGECGAWHSLGNGT